MLNGKLFSSRLSFFSPKIMVISKKRSSLLFHLSDFFLENTLFLGAKQENQRSILGEDLFFLENTMIFGEKVQDEIKTLSFLLKIHFQKYLSRCPKFEYPPLLTRPFIPHTLSKLLEGTLAWSHSVMALRKGDHHLCSKAQQTLRKGG